MKKSDRLGTVLLAAGVLLAGLLVALLYWNQVRVHRETTRIQGVAMVRALSAADLPRLVPAPGGASSLLAALTSVQRNDGLAYGAVVSASGQTLLEVGSPGAIVPPATMPAEPASWFGEHYLTSPGDGRSIREFFGPVLSQGELAGYVRVGYYDTPRFLGFAQISSIAMMALPVFLLTAVSVFMIRRETRPLAALGERIAEAEAAYAGPRLRFREGSDLRDFTQRFDAFVALIEDRVRETQQQRIDAVAQGRMLSYKHEKTEAVLNAIADAVLVVDEACMPTLANQRVEQLLGVSREELLGKAPEKWCRHPALLAHLQQVRAAGGAAAMHAGSFEYSPPDEPGRRIEVSTYPLFSPRSTDTVYGLLLVLRDISAQHIARQAGMDFVGRVAHELKTPLATLSAYSELLLGYAGMSDQERVDAVNVIRDEVERTNALVQNLLNISMMEAGTMPIVRRRVNLQDLVNDTIKTMRSRAEARNVSLELKLPTQLRPARLDKDLFRVALENVVGNAVKYSNPGGVVTLGAEDNGEELEITVADQGIGIAAPDRARVFEKYFRSGGEEARARVGHGLGLYLAKQIVELHHGTISVSSEPGKGSRFTIALPLHQAQLEEPAGA